MKLSFSPTAEQFTADNALYLARASAIAYDPCAVAKAGAANNLGLTLNFQFFDIPQSGLRDTQAFAAATETHAVLAFRGTEVKQWKDWMTDLQATPGDSQWLFSDEVNVGMVHAGFGHALADSWAEISQWIEENAIRNQKPLWITGHSLGGALAVLSSAICSFDPDLANIHIQGVYTYGQPRVGFRNFCSLLDRRLRDRIFRFVNNRDPVPRVPFRAFDYNHVGRLIQFDAHGEPQTDGSYWNTLLSKPYDKFSAILKLIKSAPPQVSDHKLDQYIGLIQAQREALAGLTFPKN